MNQEDHKDREAKIFKIFILRGLRGLSGSRAVKSRLLSDGNDGSTMSFLRKKCKAHPCGLAPRAETLGGLGVTSAHPVRDVVEVVSQE